MQQPQRGSFQTRRVLCQAWPPKRSRDRLTKYDCNASSSKQGGYGSGLGRPYKQRFVVTHHLKIKKILGGWKICGIFMRDTTVDLETSAAGAK